jgi:hypothetical protein
MGPHASTRLIGGTILRGVSSVPLAACLPRSAAVDDQIDGETREHQRHAAADLCSRCPVRARCPSRWTDRSFS